MVVKSHRQLRHEREHNELADWMAEKTDVLRPYATHIALGAILLVAAVLGGLYYFGTSNQAAADEWAAYFTALNEREPEKALEVLVTTKPNTPPGLWAAQTLGDINLARGSTEMFRDRAVAKEKLEAALGFYQKAEKAPNDLNLVARARLGIGKVYEALCKPEEALKYYKLVADTQKESAIGLAAAKAAKRMENPRDVELLAWFATQTPKKPAPLPGAGGGLPGLPNDLPDRPDISPPSGLGLDNIGTGVPEAPAPSLPLPATTTPSSKTPDETKPDGDAPAAEKPLTEKPAAEKPAAESPASENPAEPKPEGDKPDDEKPADKPE
jgi:hypothetical protein